MKKVFFRVAIASATLALITACGGGGGTAATSSVNLSGTAGKGLLIGADVKAYEIVNGTLSSTAWASTTTNNSGAYVLSGTPTSNPVVVVVSANGGTTMLDESSATGDAFATVPAPANLKLRSFVTSLSQNDSVQVNPLTESAVSMAEQAVNSTNTKLGLTKDSLLIGKQYAAQLAPAGVNPFTITLPAKPSDLTNTQTSQMAQMMAGLMSSATTSCDVQCQVKGLSKDVTITVSSSGTPTISSEVANALSQTKVAALTAGQQAWSSNTTLASKSIDPSTQDNTVEDTVIAVDKYADINSVQGFVNTLRESFKTTETKLRTAQSSLDQKYKTLSLQGLEYVSQAVSVTLRDCLKESTFSCTNTAGSTTTWTASGDGWNGSAIDSYYGYTITGHVSGNLNRSSISLKITNALVKKGGVTVAEISELTASAEATLNSNNSALTSGNLTLAGTVKAYDQTAGSDIVVALSLSDVTAKFNESQRTFGFKGNVSLASNKNDSLTGSLDVSGVKKSVVQYGYTYDQNLINKASITLKATESSTGEVMALSLSGTRDLPDYTTATNSSNFEKFNVSASLNLAQNTKVELSAIHQTWGTMSQSITLTSGTSKLSLSGQYTEGNNTSNDSWCNQESGAILCTKELTLIANDGTYTARVTQSNGTPSADLYKGSATSGTKIGVITNAGMIEVDGKSYSLY